MLLLLQPLPSSTNPATPLTPAPSRPLVPLAATHAHGFSRGFSTGAGLCSLSCKFQMHKSNATHLIFTISLCFAAAAPAPAFSQAYAKGCCALTRVCECLSASVCECVCFRFPCLLQWLTRYAVRFGWVYPPLPLSLS